MTVNWRDFANQAKPYQTLTPGARYTQPTYAGHIWDIRDEGGACLAQFTATVSPGIATAVAPAPAAAARSATATAHGTYADFAITGYQGATHLRLRLGTAAPKADHTFAKVVAGADSDGRDRWSPTIDGLEPGTEYFWVLSATSAGGQVSYQQGSFRTLYRHVEVSFESITIDNDANIFIGHNGRPYNGMATFTLMVGTDLRETLSPAAINTGDVLNPQRTLLDTRAGALLTVIVQGDEDVQNIFIGQQTAVAFAVFDLRSIPERGNGLADTNTGGRSFTLVGDQGLKFTVNGIYTVTYADW